MSDMLNLERGTIPKNPRKFKHSFLFTEYVALYFFSISFKECWGTHSDELDKNQAQNVCGEFRDHFILSPSIAGGVNGSFLLT